MIGTALLFITAIAALISSLASVGLLLVGWRTLRGAADQLRLLREQAEREARPYVVISVVPGLHGLGAWDLIMQNVGRSTARSVRLDIGDPAPPDDDDYIVAPLLSFASTPRDLVPGERLRVMWARDTENVTAGVIDSASATVTYTDDAENPYSEQRRLSIEASKATPAPSEGSRVHSSSGQNELKNIERALRSMNSHLGELRR